MNTFKVSRSNLVSKMNVERNNEVNQGHREETNNNKHPNNPLHKSGGNVRVEDHIEKEASRSTRDSDENLLDEFQEYVNEKDMLEELIDVRLSDIPAMSDFDLFEANVSAGLNLFRSDNIDIVEEHNYSKTKANQRKLPSRKPNSGKILHDCKICGKVFMTSSSLGNHEEIHQKNLVCRMCQKICRSSKQMESHLKSHGVLGKSQKLEENCPTCHQVRPCQCSHLQSPKNRIKTTSFKCKKCESVYGNKSELVRHQRTEHNMYKNLGTNCGKVAQMTQRKSMGRKLSVNWSQSQKSFQI